MINLNRRVTVRVWGTTQNEIGSPVAGEVTNWELWAAVEERNGANSSPYQQQVWQYDYRVTVRYERTRILNSNYTLDYDGKRLLIHSLSFSNEAAKKYCVLRCSAIDANISGPIPQCMQIGVYDYTATGGEDSFTALTGKQVFGAFKDGILFEIITSGSPVGKQVLRTIGTGLFTWGVPFEPDEVAVIQYVI